MNTKSRLGYATQNAAWGILQNIVVQILRFISRTVFIYTIGITYLGINGLFSNILGFLSFAELGIGSAINFSLYEPLATNNIEKIKTIMRVYKKAYHMIALIIGASGLALIPFLPHIIKDADGIKNIEVYYLIALFNTVSSYFISYKTSLIAADQKGYMITRITIVFQIIITFVQIVVLLVWRSYIGYLLVNTVIPIFEKLIDNFYINKKYPYLLEKKIFPLDKEEKGTIIRNVKGLVFHQVGTVCVTQTDSIIISAFISVVLVGIVSNYSLIISTITGLVSVVFTGMQAGFGNVVATESVDKSEDIFLKCSFLAFMLYGFCFVELLFLLTPAIRIWIGNEQTISPFVVLLLCFSMFITGLRKPFDVMKSAAGVFYQDRWVPIVESAVNLIVSIIGVMLWGLPGVYIGTICSSVVWIIARPIVVYKCIFKKSSTSYFKKYVSQLIFIFSVILILHISLQLIIITNKWLEIIVYALLIAIIYAIMFALVYRKNRYLIYYCKLLKRCLNRKKSIR